MKINIQDMPYLSKTALENSFQKNSNTMRNSLVYWDKIGRITRVKRGFYVYSNFLDKRDNSLYYSRFLATKMIEPSYISMESILQDYQMFTDVVYGYSVVTVKKTNSLVNDFGNFNYRSIKQELFMGFSAQSYGNMTWYVATKAKALFDYIYFNKQKFSDFSKNEVEGLRLNLEMMKKKDWQEYEKYLTYSGKKMLKIYKILRNSNDN